MTEMHGHRLWGRETKSEFVAHWEILLSAICWLLSINGIRATEKEIDKSSTYKLPEISYQELLEVHQWHLIATASSVTLSILPCGTPSSSGRIPDRSPPTNRDSTTEQLTVHSKVSASALQRDVGMCVARQQSGKQRHITRVEVDPMRWYSIVLKSIQRVGTRRGSRQHRVRLTEAWQGESRRGTA